MEEALRALLRGDAEVAAIVGQRVDWSLRPQGRRVPAISLWRISGGDAYVMDGVDGEADSTVQVDCWAVDFPAAKALASAVKTAVSGHRTAPFGGIFVEAERDGFEDDPAKLLFRTSLDLRVWHTSA